MSEEEYDFIVGFTLFTPKGFRTMYRHFENLEIAEMFASNVNIKDSHKIYVDLDLYNKEKEKNKILEDKIITIRKLTTPYNVWYDLQTQCFQLKGCTKQEIYETFSKIRSEVSGEYCFLSDEEAIQKILNEED